jgi:hypothetical protein
MPTANLSSISDDVLLRLSGTYCGWISFIPNKGLELPTDLLEDWHQAVITVAPITDAKAAVVMRKEVRAYLIQDFEPFDFYEAKVSVMVMGMIRPQARITLGEIRSVQSELIARFNDIAIAQASLCRPMWGVDHTLTRISTEKSNRSFSDKFGDARRSVQKQTDKIPFHNIGIRTDSMAVRDRLVGNGGVSVPR